MGIEYRADLRDSKEVQSAGHDGCVEYWKKERF